VLEHESMPTAIRMSLVVGDQDDQRRESKKENLYEFVQASGILYGALAQLEVPSTDNLTPVAGRRSPVTIQDETTSCSELQTS